MTKLATPMKKQQRAHYTDAYREEALLLAERLTCLPLLPE